MVKISPPPVPLKMTTSLELIRSAEISETTDGAEHPYGDFSKDRSGKYCVAWQQGSAGSRSIFARIFTPVFNKDSATPNVPEDWTMTEPFLVAENAHASFNSGNNECKRPEVVGLTDGSFIISYVRKKTDGTIHDANSAQIEFKRFSVQGRQLFGQASGLGAVVDATVTLGVSDGFSRMVAEPNGRFTIFYIHEVSYNDSGANNFRTFDIRASSWVWPHTATAPTNLVAQTTVISAFPVDDSDSIGWALASAAVGLFDVTLAANGDYHLVYERANGAASSGDRTRIEYRRIGSAQYATPFFVIETQIYDNTEAAAGDRDRPQRRPRLASLHPWEWGTRAEDTIALVQGDQFFVTPEDSSYVFRMLTAADNAAISASVKLAIPNTNVDADNESTGKADTFLRPDGVGVVVMSVEQEAGIGGNCLFLHDSEGDSYRFTGRFISSTRPDAKIAKGPGNTYFLAIAHEGRDVRGENLRAGVSFLIG